MSPQISQLFIYPVKSCAGISVPSFQFDNKGPLLDRRWMLVDRQTGIFLSQREIPQLALISTRIEDGEVWVGQAEDETLAATQRLPKGGELIDVKVWDDSVRGYDCGDLLAGWFSQLLSRECRLVYQGDCERVADEKYTDKGTAVGFSDGFPLLVVAQSSIDVLNMACDAEISALNFRPNIVIENTPSFAESDWQFLTINSSEAAVDQVEMAVVKPCERCVIPLLNPRTAQREAAILPVLLKYCRPNKKIIFGQNLTFKVSQGVGINVGQKVLIS
ncbi:MAG: hypothetical protein ACI978_001108 [Oleispira sp.]|jgi:uncharacterized protein YcbX